MDSDPVVLTLVVDKVFETQCLYIDGTAWHRRTQDYVTAEDIVMIAAGEPCILEVKHINFEECHEPWPKKLSRALRKP